MIAALYVAPGGIYWRRPGVEPWGMDDRGPGRVVDGVVTRDARDYPGPSPVVAHPPCTRWCRLAGLVEARWGHRRGEDGGCFAAALAAWGSVSPRRPRPSLPRC